MSHHSDDDPPPPNPSQDMSKNWPLSEPLLQLARTVYQRDKTTIETVSGILRNENDTQTANSTSQTASPATSSAEPIREKAHVAQDRLGSKHEVQELARDSKSDACNPEDPTPEDSARQDVASDDTGSRDHTEEIAIFSANHSISASTPSLVRETDITQLAATPPTTTQLLITQSATTQLATESLIDTKADRGQNVQKEFVKNEKQEERGGVIDGEEHTARKPKTSLMKAHTSKRVSATSSEDISRIPIGGLNPPDQLCQGKNQVGDARVPDCLSNLVDKNSDGRVDIVEEEARERVHGMDEERQRDAVNVGEPAITPPAPVDDTRMGSTPVDLMLDPVTAVGERTGAPVWGGFWKDIKFWPGDLMSTLPPLGQTTENWSVTRRHWLEGCSVFWSKREQAEAFRITWHMKAGPERGISMDKWVNDLDREAVRAKYLSHLH